LLRDGVGTIYSVLRGHHPPSDYLLPGAVPFGDDLIAEMKKPIRRFKEKIDREITFTVSGKRVQRSRRVEIGKQNPAKLTIAKGGDWEVFSYPYSNTEYVFLRIKDEIELFEGEDLRRLLARISARIKSYLLRMKIGVKRRNLSGCSFQRAYDSGIEAFAEAQSLNKKEHTLRIERLGSLHCIGAICRHYDEKYGTCRLKVCAL